MLVLLKQTVSFRHMYLSNIKASEEIQHSAFT